MIGAVLAGGKSRRFGEDKLFFKIGGKPLILYALQALEKVQMIDEIVIVASRRNFEKAKKLGYEVVVDEMEIGPISGLYTALSLGDIFVVGGDMPALIPEFIDYIIMQFNNYGNKVCIPRWPNGYLEPLHAAYRREFREVLEVAIKKGMYRLSAIVESSRPCYIDITRIPKEWYSSFFNINRKEDLRIIKSIRNNGKQLF
ncbi:molybdenum cofactor guanylyltransferase MobA [Pyrococcus sp. ST04]|uniref:molybdenum cofactor guanylyltransferase MobA n=1 Tax=Pyrococcus sp. ST04 TaxID=1183377 RepID=UPI0002605E4B|nr:molybdenum cofactor guanylyltransferase MobA [Pyrococcus sp. ST04]AFK22558.1 putative molybdopterin-guanine dinucleotide biosynthesis protein A [Pyrococcus sp. ST04]